MQGSVPDASEPLKWNEDLHPAEGTLQIFVPNLNSPGIWNEDLHHKDISAPVPDYELIHQTKIPFSMSEVEIVPIQATAKGMVGHVPAAIAIPYFIIEILAFIGVVMWLGFGWALGLLALFFIGGLLLAGVELRRISRSAAIHQASGQGSAGAIAGNIGLTAAGAILVAMPGFVSSIVGLLFIFSPTRALFRKMLAKRLRGAIENMGVRGFEAVNGYRTQASYGNFGAAFNPEAQPAADPIVLDEEEIQTWTSDLKPEDFNRPNNQPKNKPEDDESDGEK